MVALAALVLSITAVVALQEARSIQIENAAARCSQDIRQQNSGSNNVQNANQNCSAGGGSGKQVVARGKKLAASIAALAFLAAAVLSLLVFLVLFLLAVVLLRRRQRGPLRSCPPQAAIMAARTSTRSKTESVFERMGLPSAEALVQT